ncbi:hypothetical protein [Pseudomonas savastanoi]|uniref:hypothetical protein n=1 Tax=Pseudomonas savastanoi TaxID=29438 RepID=UPI000E328D3C|nr:hypothetical protein [Pseudomonas savastanoi]
MVPVELLKAAIDQLPKWNLKVTSSLTWVNWRQGFQIKMGWYDGASLLCYLDFKDNQTARDSVLRRVFEIHADAGQKPRLVNGHGWSRYEYELRTTKFISVNEVAEIAQSMGYEFNVLYVQECIGARPVFDTMEIPLIPGEMGKEWVGGGFIPYSCPMGMNL